MRNLIVLFLLLTACSFSVCAQKNPPENVKKEFTKKYDSAQSVKWDNEEKNEWEAEFKLEGKKMSACFDYSGKWIDSETVISEKELPAAILNSLKTEYPGYKKGLIEIFESPELNGYEMTLKKGESTLEVIFDKSGKTLKKSEVKEED